MGGWEEAGSSKGKEVSWAYSNNGSPNQRNLSQACEQWGTGAERPGGGTAVLCGAAPGPNP